MAITLEDIQDEVAKALVDSLTLREWCATNCGRPHRVNVLYDPKDKTALDYTPFLVIVPAIEEYEYDTKFGLQVWCRVTEPKAQDIPGYAGTSFRKYLASGRVSGLADQARAAIAAHLSDTNLAVDRYRKANFDFRTWWPVVQCKLDLGFDVPGLIGADLEIRG